MGKVWGKGGDQTCHFSTPYVTPKVLQRQDCKLLIDIKYLKFPCREIFLSIFKLEFVKIFMICFLSWIRHWNI